jgi:hypothetical protein
MARSVPPHPLVNLALNGLSQVDREKITKSTGDYLRSLESIGIIRKGKNQFQTDSCIFTPVFNSLSNNSQPLISPKKLAWGSSWGSKIIASDSIFRTGNASGVHTDRKLTLRSTDSAINNVVLSTLKFNDIGQGFDTSKPITAPDVKTPAIPDVDDVLEYNGYYISFYVAPGSTAAGTTISYGRGPAFCEVYPDVIGGFNAGTTIANYNSAKLVFRSLFTSGGENGMSIPASSGPGMYLYNIKKIPKRVVKDSKWDVSELAKGSVQGYEVWETIYFLGAAGATPQIIMNRTRTLDPQVNYEAEYEYKTLSDLLSTRNVLHRASLSSRNLASYADILGHIRSSFPFTGNQTTTNNSLTRFSRPQGYPFARTTRMNTISSEDIENFYKGITRTGLNRQIITAFTALYNGIDGQRLRNNQDRPGERQALNVLNGLFFTQDVRQSISLPTYRQTVKNLVNSNPAYNFMEHKFGQSGFTMPWTSSQIPASGGTPRLTVGRVRGSTQFMQGSYKFIGAGTGITSEQDVNDFMNATMRFIDSVPAL